MTIRLSDNNFAGIARTLVAVGISSDLSMLAATVLATPRSGVFSVSLEPPPSAFFEGRSVLGFDCFTVSFVGFAGGAEGVFFGWALGALLLVEAASAFGLVLVTEPVVAADVPPALGAGSSDACEGW